MTRCLYCYDKIDDAMESEFHPACAKKFFGVPEAPKLPYDSSEMSMLAKKVLDRSVAVPGVQPKISMGLIEEVLKTGQNGRMTVLDALEGQYILKPQNENFPLMPENEHLTMRLAELFKILVVPSSLMRLKSGELCYVSRRIDRTLTGEMNHMIDFMQILGLEDKYYGTMEQVGKKVGELSSYILYDKFRFFELAVFNFIVGNNDMHLKNFSMLLLEDKWSLAPAYDLLNVKIVLPKDSEELALKLGGKKKKLNRAYFERFAVVLGLNPKQVLSVFNRIGTWLPKAEKLIASSFLPEPAKQAYFKVVQDRLGILGLLPMRNQ